MDFLGSIFGGANGGAGGGIFGGGLAGFIQAIFGPLIKFFSGLFNGTKG